MRALLVSAAIVAAASPLAGATRLTATVNGNIVPLEWPANTPIQYKVDQRLLGALPGGQALLDKSFGTWSSIPNANVEFREVAVESGLRAAKDGQSVVTISDDLFANQKAIAVTETWDVAGKLTEADIQIDATMINSGYNLQQAITHEIGHLLGLDHSASLSAVMYPYVTRSTDAVVLDSDDRVAIAAIYPRAESQSQVGILRGRVVGDTGGIFAAQVVAVNERGEAVATALTNSAGEYALEALPTGKYRIYAEPLDGPVDPRQLSPYWRQAKVTPFPTEFYNAEVDVEAGRVYGNLVVRSTGPVLVNPKWVGVSASGASDFKLISAATGVKSGQAVAIAVGGDGMTSGMTTFEVLSPFIKRTSDFRYAANYVYANFEIAGDAPAGSSVILVRSGNQEAMLTGALRIQGNPPRARGARH